MTNYKVTPLGNMQSQNGIQGRVAGPTGQFANVNRALGTPLGRVGMNAAMGVLNGQDPGKALMGAGMDYGKSELMKYGAKQLLGGALGGQAAGFLGGPYGMLAMAALPYVGKGISSLGRSLGIGKRSGPSAQEMAMGQAKNDMMGYKGSYAADMGRGQSMLDKYNPMLEAQIGKLQDLSERGLSTDYNTRRMAGAAASNAAATRAAEARLASQGGMIGGGQGLSQYAGIGQTGVAGNAAGAYQAAINDMNQQPGYINQLAGMIGGQINRGQGLLNQGRQGMFGIDQNIYNLNAQEKARADALSQANRAREAQMISGVANLAGTAAGMEQSRKQNRDLMNMIYGNQDSKTTSGSNPSGSVPPNLSFDDTPINPDGSYSVLPPNYEGSMSVVPYSNSPKPGEFGHDPERDAMNYDPNTNAVNSRSTPDFFDAQQFGRQFTAPPQITSNSYPQFLQQLFRGNTYSNEGSQSVPPYAPPSFDPQQFGQQFTRPPQNSAQTAQYVQDVIRQMFGGR